MKQVLDEAATQAGLEKAGFCWPVIERSGVNGSGEKLHYLLHYSGEEKSVVCPYVQVTDILSGETYRQGDDILLKDWDVKILVEE